MGVHAALPKVLPKLTRHLTTQDNYWLKRLGHGLRQTDRQTDSEWLERCGRQCHLPPGVYQAVYSEKPSNITCDMLVRLLVTRRIEGGSGARPTAAFRSALGSTPHTWWLESGLCYWIGLG